jgi:hypothetical protein
MAEARPNAAAPTTTPIPTKRIRGRRQHLLAGGHLCREPWPLPSFGGVRGWRARGVHKLGPTRRNARFPGKTNFAAPTASAAATIAPEPKQIGFLGPHTVACRDTCSCVVDVHATKSRRPGFCHRLPQGRGLGAPPHRALKPQPQFRAPGWVDSSPRGRDHDLFIGTGLWKPQPQPESRGAGGAAAAPFAAALRRGVTSSRGQALCGAWPWCGALDDRAPGIQSLPDPHVGLQFDLCVCLALRSRGRCGV